MKKSIIVILFSLLAGEAFSQAKQFAYGNERRRYTVYVPKEYSAKSDKMYPVVFNFHGGGMTMTEQMFYSRMNDAADKHGFIVVYPQGIKQDWNVGFEMSYKHGTDDIGFINALLTKLFSDYKVDKKRVYATGLSRGGFFCQRLAAELPGTFAAVASIGATLPDSVGYYHRSKAPVSVMNVHGTVDEIVNYLGKKDAYLSANATFDYWRKHNGLMNSKESVKTIDKMRSDSTSVTIREVSGAGRTVSLVLIENGGHTWPGSHAFNIGFPLGKTSYEIDMNEVVWRFFSKHSKN